MPIAAPNLSILANETSDFSDSLYDTAVVLDDSREILSLIRHSMKLPGRIAKVSDKLHKVADSGEKVAKVFSKVGVLKVVADPFSRILYQVDERVLDIEKKAKALDLKFKPFLEKLDIANKVMRALEYGLKEEASATKNLSGRFETVSNKLDDAKIFATVILVLMPWAMSIPR